MAGSEIVPFEQYAIARVDTNDLLETIRSNIGDAQINERNLDRVKMPSGGSITWSVPTLDGDVDTKELVGVVIYSKLVRAYWTTSYDEGEGNDVPDCSSPDSTHAYPPNAEFTPPADQHPDGGFACSTCALAKFGSGDGGRGQACQQRRLLFMLTQNDVLPFVVSLSPTSLKAASDYMLRLTRGGLPYWRVGTRVTLEKHTDPKPHARAVFTKAFDLSEEDVKAIAEYRDALVPALSAIEIVERPAEAEAA